MFGGMHDRTFVPDPRVPVGRDEGAAGENGTRAGPQAPRLGSSANVSLISN